MSCPEIDEHIIIINASPLKSFEEIRIAILSISFLPEADNSFYIGLMKENERPNESIP